MNSKFFLATKYLARFFMYLLPCGVHHLFLWILVTFISHKDVYGYKEAKKVPCVHDTSLEISYIMRWCVALTGMEGWVERWKNK